MHELSLAASVLDIAVRHAAGRKILRIDLDVGALRQASPSALTFGFEILSEGTPAHGAELAIREIPARGECRACGAVTELESFPLICGSCGAFDLKIVTGEELAVASMEVEDEA